LSHVPIWLGIAVNGFGIASGWLRPGNPAGGLVLATAVAAMLIVRAYFLKHYGKVKGVMTRGDRVALAIMVTGVVLMVANPSRRALPDPLIGGFGIALLAQAFFGKQAGHFALPGVACLGLAFIHLTPIPQPMLEGIHGMIFGSSMAIACGIDHYRLRMALRRSQAALLAGGPR
jgi:hypothetical protein